MEQQNETVRMQQLDESNSRLSETGSEEIVFSQQKRRRYIVLNYLAANYLKIIVIISIIAIISVVANVILVIFNIQQHGTQRTEPHPDLVNKSQTAQTINNVTSHEVLATMLPIVTTHRVPVIYDEDKLLTARISSKLNSVNSTDNGNKQPDPTQTIRFAKGIPCNGVDCGRYRNPCNITDFSYHSIRIYSCCKCIKIGSTEPVLLQYQAHTLDTKVSIIVKGEVKYCREPWRLNGLPDLQCLKGSWDTQIGSPRQCDLQYTIIASACVYTPDD